MTGDSEFPLAYLLLDIGSSFAGVELPPAGVHQFLAQFDELDWYCHGYRVEDVQAGWLISVRLPPLPDGALVLQVPGLDFVSLVLEGERFNDHPVLEIVDPVGEGGYLELRNLRVALRINHDLLRPVGDAEHVELSYTGSLRMDRHWQFHLTGDPSLALTPCEIGKSGIVVAFSGVQFDLRKDRVIPPLQALGYHADFVGIYAEDGYVEVLPQSVFGSTPGLRVICRECVIGSSGISGEIRQYYELEIVDGAIDPASGLVGYLFDEDLQLALEATEITLRDNRVTGFTISGWLRLPVLETVIAARFGLQALPGGSYGYRLGLTQKTPRTFEIGALTLTVSDLDLNGSMRSDSFDIAGQVSAELSLPGFILSVQSAEMAIAHAPGQDRLRIELENVEFGPLAQVDRAKLQITSTRNDAGERDLRLHMETALRWSDLKERLDLDQLPDFLPLPPDDAEITALLTWEDDTLVVRFSATVTGLDGLWRFVPVVYRPEVRTAALVFRVEYDSAVEFTNASSTTSLSTEFSLDLSLRLPDLPEGPFGDLINLDTGDEEGWIDGTLRAGLETDPNGEPTWRVAMSVENGVTLTVQIPGMVQDEAPLQTALTSLSFDIASSDDGVAGTMTLKGNFELRPIDPPAFLPFAAQLQQLMAPVQDTQTAGSVALTLAFEDDKAALALDCQFEDADLNFDIFDVMGHLAGGATGGGEEIPLDLDVGFAFKGVRVELGSLQDGDAAHFLFQFALSFALPGIDPVDCHFRLSDEEFSLGISRAVIPMEIPSFPISLEDLAALSPPTPADSAWSVALWENEIATLQDAFDALDDDPQSAADRRSRRQLGGKLFLLKNLKGIHSLMSGPSNERLLQTYTELLIGAFDEISAVTHFESDIELVLENVALTIPFDNPQSMGLAGTAYLDGFADDDPFKAIEGIHMTLGLSADQIYFELENPGDPIPLPDLGRYPGGSVNLSRLRIGYAYSRNALSVTFAGALVLPPQLVNDADTSDLIGAGIRLPTHNALSFRLDLIPVTLGAVDFVIPLFEFDLDLRKPHSPALVRSLPCQPYWDGLQVIVPGIYHDGLKRLAFSPLFSMSIIPNFRFDGDLMLGDDQTGLTVVADEVLVLIGYYSGGTPVPIPFFASPTEPYFDNLCVNLRFAGFGLNFNLQRPFPSLSPLALFEILGLLADPMMRIDPNGSLAKTVRISLTDGVLTLPETVSKMFPGLDSVTREPVNVTLNLGNFIAATQHLAASLGDISDALDTGGRTLQQRVGQLRNSPPDAHVSSLLEMLPPELRKQRVSGSFAGFDATAVLVILDANDTAQLKQMMMARGHAPPVQTAPGLALGVPTNPGNVRRYRPNLPDSSGFARELRPDDLSANLLLGIEFEGFEPADIDALPVPSKNMNGVLVGAHVKLFAGQRYRFLGSIFEDGSFGLISAVDVRPLKVTVDGIPVDLPLQVSGRLEIAGRAKRDGVTGHLAASVRADWNALPGLARLTFGETGSPLRLKLFSDGKFRVQGPGSLDLFHGATRLEGQIDISERHCLVRGDLTYRVGDVINLALACQGRLGPANRFQLAGSGDLKILGQTLASVRGEVTEAGATVSAQVDVDRLLIAGKWLDCRLRGRIGGHINLAKRTRPEFDLQGEGTLSLFGAQIDGRAAVRHTRRGTELDMKGALGWQGHRWLEGHMRVNDTGVALSGRLALGVPLSPSNIANTQLAHLFLRIDLVSEITLDTAAALGRFDIRGECSLSARMPGSDQTLPLAVRRVRGHGTTQLEIPLVEVNGFSMLPFDGITIPVPTITPNSSPSPIRFGEITHNGPLGQVNNPAASWAGHKLELIGGAVPVVSSGSLSTAQTKRTVPIGYTIGLDGENPVSINVPFDASFSMALVWRPEEKDLALRIRRSGIPDQFFAISNLV